MACRNPARYLIDMGIHSVLVCGAFASRDVASRMKALKNSVLDSGFDGRRRNPMVCEAC